MDDEDRKLDGEELAIRRLAVQGSIDGVRRGQWLAFFGAFIVSVPVAIILVVKGQFAMALGVVAAPITGAGGLALVGYHRAQKAAAVAELTASKSDPGSERH